MEKILQLDQHYSMIERRADEMTREVSGWLRCDFMQNQAGNTFSGIIASVTGLGFFVRLNDLFVDGLVHVSSLNNDYYHFNQVGQQPIDEFGGQTYRLGGHMEVHVEAVNIGEHKIDSGLISNERVPRNVGGTARKKTKESTSGKPGGRRRQVGKQVNFEPDSAFRKGKDQTKAKPRDEKKAREPSAKTQEVAATTKAKRAARKKTVE